ncbi:hypothetical protein [Psychrobacter sp. Sarcosine-3u-12]|uniref:hypothetical protein n=1 Tax=Psychrobacter sp. Sarcosine-3u-12 TaxID=2058325 RepID=UPI000C34615E|nr:hypothetical protein [Psychrobacter sp. Sarcosine-3u-12]PKG36207.1 hypothetical protein CXF65_03755 [Psychrobacter sp. Sarcosine-3u-12]
MKDYKLLLAGLLLLLLMILIAVFTWLWSSNRKNMDPLPILASESETIAEGTDEDADTSADRTLYLQIEDSLQIPLDHVITSFESRYPHVQVFTNYVNSTALLTLPNNNHNGNESAPVVTHADIIIADNILSSERLLPLQTKLKDAQDKRSQSSVDTDDATQDSTDSLNVSELFSEADAATDTSDNTEARRLNSFSYALRDEHALDGVILTHNTVAINFRNFLLSSTGQDILKKYNYYNIEGYKNSVDELFKPTSQAKKPLGDNGEDVADALSNGE